MLLAVYICRGAGATLQGLGTPSPLFLYVFLSPSLDKKRGQTESSNSEGENKGKDNRLLGPSNPENKARAGRVSTCCKTELGIYPGHCQVFFRMSAVQSDRLGTIPEHWHYKNFTNFSKHSWSWRSSQGVRTQNIRVYSFSNVQRTRCAKAFSVSAVNWLMK